MGCAHGDAAAGAEDMAAKGLVAESAGPGPASPNRSLLPACEGEPAPNKSKPPPEDSVVGDVINGLVDSLVFCQNNILIELKCQQKTYKLHAMCLAKC